MHFLFAMRRSRFPIAVVSLAIIVVGSSGVRKLLGDETAIVSMQPSVSVDTDVDQVLVAESFDVQYTVRAPKNSTVDFPKLERSLGPFEIVDQGDIRDVISQKDPHQRIWSKRFRLESLSSGEMIIPAIEIQVLTDGIGTRLDSKEVSIRVVSSIAEDEDPANFRDIQPVIDPDKSASDASSIFSSIGAWGLVGSVGVLLGLFLLGGLMIRRRRPPTYDLRWARQRLRQLQDSDSVQNGDWEFASSEMASIIRQHFRWIGTDGAAALTTAEWLQFAEKVDRLPSDKLDSLRQSLELLDQAKFAQTSLSSKQLQNAIDSIDQWLANRNDGPSESPSGSSAEIQSGRQM